MTTVKKDPLVEVLLATPRQPQPNSTILATWQFGLGRSVVLTTDIGERWATDWPAWGGYEKLMLQTVRWSMRGHDLDERLAMTTEVNDGAIDVVINALDRGEDHLNYLTLSGTAVLPSGETRSFPVEQVAPGRYVTKVEADEPGNYYLSISGGGRAAPLRTAISVSNTAELQKLASNDSFMIHLAEEKPKGGEPGAIIASPRGFGDKERLLTTNVFRPGLAAAKSRELMWPIVVLAASVVFLSDVLVRRVMFSFGWLPVLVAWPPLGWRPTADAASPRMERLKRSKASVTQRIESAQSAARFEPTLGADAVVAEFAKPTDAKSSAGAAAVEVPSAIAEGEAGAASPEFTARLLDAKKRIREGRERQE
ncbi:MAG: hypothetical protein WD468_03630, partial [Pirellulales bacterium]